MKIEFETYRQIGSYEIGSLKNNKPSAVNFLSYKRFKVTIEPIEESNEVYIKRLEDMLLLEENKGFNVSSRIKSEIEELKKLKK